MFGMGLTIKIEDFILFGRLTGDEYYYNQQYHFCQQIFSYFF